MTNILSNSKIVRSKAPLRLGLAGGGTDVSPYCDLHGGCVLNATINMYAHCSLELNVDNKVIFNAPDICESWSEELSSSYAVVGKLILHKAVYNRIIKQFNNDIPLPITLTTYSDAPPGSGLGSSSTMVVAMIRAFTELLKLPLGEYDIAHIAYEIEREDCHFSGGKQDQYAATFGGFNFIEFNADNHIIVNPLRIKNTMIHELEAHLLLFYTGTSRDSAKIIDDQSHSVHDKNTDALEGMHKIKDTSFKMKESLLRGNIGEMSDVLNESWVAKKQTSKVITNAHVDNIYTTAIEAGAMSAKLSGAGGGGFMMLFVDPIKKVAVTKALNSLENGKTYNVNFTKQGALGWIV